VGMALFDIRDLHQAGCTNSGPVQHYYASVGD
jgi:hypothetical protein